MRALFYLPNTNCVYLFCKKCHFNKKDLFSSQSPKSTIFWAFVKFSFPFFSSFLFCFIQPKKDKNKKCTFLFFSKPFLTPRQPAKKYFHTPTHYLCFVDPKNTKSHWGKTSKKNLGQIFDSTLAWFWLKKRPNLGQIFDSTVYIYICAYGDAPEFWAKKMAILMPNTGGKIFFGSFSRAPEFGCTGL